MREDVIEYLESTTQSLVYMLAFSYGMATQLNLLWIIMAIFAVQMGYRMIKSARSRGVVEANFQDVARVKRGTILFEGSEKEVKKAKQGKGSDDMAKGIKMAVGLLVPIAIFLILPQVLTPMGFEQWQSYIIAFLLSMPVSAVLTFKMGMSRGAMAVTPNSYIVGDRGIVFNHMGQPFLLRFPLRKLNVRTEKNFVEAEGKSEADVIPHKLRLFSDRVDQLEKVLARNLDQGAHGGKG